MGVRRPPRAARSARLAGTGGRTPLHRRTRGACRVPVLPAARANFCNQLRFVALDLLYSHQVQGHVLEYLLENGMTYEEYDWFIRSKSGVRAILGIDYCKANEMVLDERDELRAD